MLDSLSPQRRRFVLVAAAVVIVAVLVVAAVTIVPRLTGSQAVPQDRPGPVLLVPGYGGGTDALAPLAALLRAEGRQVEVVDPSDGGVGDLAQQAEQLDRVARRTRDAAGAESVDVIGYSAGGVVARLWVREHGGAAVARRVLTLGSPHHGTSQAALGQQLGGGCPVACTQLVPNSDLLRRLNAGDETPAGPSWITLRSDADVVVTPVDSAALEGALNVGVQDLCPGSRSNHGDLPGDPVTSALVGTALGVGPPTVPTRVSC